MNQINLMHSIVLHNSTYYGSILKNLTLKYVQYLIIPETGYKTEVSKVSLPIITQDEANVYNNVRTGSHIFDVPYAVFNDELLFNHKTYNIKVQISDREMCVYDKNNLRKNGIDYVDFISSEIHNCRDLVFEKCYFEDTVMYNVAIDEFRKCDFERAVFNNCNFVSGFNDCNVRNCVFNNCYFVVGFVESNITDCVFNNCKSRGLFFSSSHNNNTFDNDCDLHSCPTYPRLAD